MPKKAHARQTTLHHGAHSRIGNEALAAKNANRRTAPPGSLCSSVWSGCHRRSRYPDPAPHALAETAQRQIEATLARALDANDTYFQREREKLEHWADDQILAAEQALQDTKSRLKDTKRRARLAEQVDEQKKLQEEIKKLERRQRQEIFEVEDEIESKRDQLIEVLERRLKQKTLVHFLFRIRWEIV